MFGLVDRVDEFEGGRMVKFYCLIGFLVWCDSKKICVDIFVNKEKRKIYVLMVFMVGLNLVISVV